MTIDKGTKNKRILYLVHSYNSFQKDTVEMLAKNFERVDVLVRYKPIVNLVSFLGIRAFNAHKKDFVFQLKDKPNNVYVHQVPLWYIPLKFLYNFLGDYHYKIALKIIKKNKIDFDLIHAHFTWTSGYVGAKLKEKCNKPLIITVHENDSWFFDEYNSNNHKLHFAWKSADVLIRVNQKTVENLKEFNMNTVFLPNGYNGNLFKKQDKISSRVELGLNLNSQILVTVGHLNKRKGFNYLIDALDIVVNSHGRSNIKCLIIGEGPERSKLQSQICKFKLNDNISILGSVEHSKISKYINASDLFVMSSLAEGTPISMLEALGCGKPYIGTNVGGIPDVITSDTFGLLCNPKDSLSLSKSIEKAIDKSWNYDVIEKYGERYTWHNVLQSVLKIYAKLLTHNI